MWVKADMMNAFHNTKTKIKKLQYGVKKCFKMHIGKACNKDICTDLDVDGWRMRNVTEVKTGTIYQEEEYAGMHPMTEVQSEKYLGDILSHDGKNEKNITCRTNRGTGIVTQIMTKLEDINFGKYYFKVAIILRNSHLISSLLTNAEAWYSLTQADLEALESVDENLLRRVLETPLSTPKEMLYLEMGVVPIRYIIKMRRLNFLQYMLHEDNDCLVHSFLKTQLENPSNGDWGQSCKKDLEELEIQMEIDDIEKMTKNKFRNLVKKKTLEKALQHLNQVKAKHSKVLHLTHTKLEMQKYLEENEMSIHECKFLFSLRSRMIDVKTNYREKHSDTMCPCCEETEDSQQHLLSCSKIESDGEIVSSVPDYQDLFGSNLSKQVNMSRILKNRFGKRKKHTTAKGGPSDPV